MASDIATAIAGPPDFVKENKKYPQKVITNNPKQIKMSDRYKQTNKPVVTEASTKKPTGTKSIPGPTVKILPGFPDITYANATAIIELSGDVAGMSAK